MNWFTGVVAYILLWWVLLFAVLPFGVKPNDKPDALTGWRGAPDRPMLGRKVLATTLIAAFVWLVFYGLNQSGWISFRSGWLALPDS